jgi:hypothetical protein
MTSELMVEIQDEIVSTERDLARLRLIRDRAAARIQDLLQEQQRLRNHLSALDKADREAEVA